MVNKYTLEGQQYAPDMEMARESCPGCGMSHMVQYRVVEVTEEVANGEFLWRTPDNEDRLRILMTSAVDSSSGGRIYAEAAATSHGVTIGYDVVSPPPVSWPSIYETLRAEEARPTSERSSRTDEILLNRARAAANSVGPRRMYTLPVTQSYDGDGRAALDNGVANPYNTPTGVWTDETIGDGSEGSVGGVNVNPVSDSMDDSVRDAGAYLRAAYSGQVR